MIDITKNSRILDIVKINQLDIEKINEAIKLLDLSKVNNIDGYLVGWLKNHIQDFKKEWKKCCFVGLHNNLRNNGFVGEDVLLNYIDLIEEHIINEFSIDKYELINTNAEIIEELVKQDKKTFQEFGKSLLAKMEGKGNIPKALLWKQAQQLEEEWKSLFKEETEEEEEENNA